MKKKNLSKDLFFIIIFLTFLGYYAILLLLFNLGLSEATRLVTIPLRLLIMGMLALLTWLNIEEGLRRDRSVGWFLLFILIYCSRLFIEYNVGSDYYVSTMEVFLYFVGFCVFPFIGILTYRVDELVLKTVFRAFLFGGALFSILSIFTYSQFIGEVGRLASYTAGEAVISPLILSYSSALTIGVLGFYLIANEPTKKLRWSLIGIIGLSMVPFFLGASRGSLIALATPFMVLLFTGRGVKFFLKSILATVVFTFLLIYLDTVLKSGLLNRFLGISSAIEEGASSAIRVEIWKQSFSQFIESPIIGGTFKVSYWRSYPHNIFLDVLQTTGLLGLVPFSILVFKAWRACLMIFKQHKEWMWIAVIFIQAFTQHMFSGVLYSGAWFWASMALVLVTQYYLKTKKYIRVEPIKA